MLSVKLSIYSWVYLWGVGGGWGFIREESGLGFLGKGSLERLELGGSSGMDCSRGAATARGLEGSRLETRGRLA